MSEPSREGPQPDEAARLPARRDDAPSPGPPAVPIFDLFETFFAGRKPTTWRAYLADFRDFARFAGAPGDPDEAPRAALQALLAASAAEANAIVLRYRASLGEDGKAPATVARRLSALRAYVKMARMVGTVAWTIEVEAPRVRAYRDTRGPTPEQWRRLLTAARRGREPAKAARDVAILLLLHDSGLRRGAVAGLDFADVTLDEDPPAVHPIGKGQVERERRTIPAKTAGALAAWIAHRGDAPGPLFHALDRATAAARVRLSGDGVWRIVRALSTAAGLPRPARPHGLRHAGITRALDLGATLRMAQKFSGHAKMDTLLLYDDNRRDDAGTVSTMLSEDVE